MKEEKIKKGLKNIFQADQISFGEAEKLAYSRDMWPKTLLWQDRDHFPYQPLAIVWPEDENQILALLELARKEGIPLVPWGGGSGVCGGTIPVQGGVAVDLKGLNRILNIDPVSHIVRAEGGIMGERLERELNYQGFTLGHFPSSIYCSTLGGWLATRSAGQLSSKYGKIEDMALSLRIVLPSGKIIETSSAPRRATGPDFSHLFLGSEGTLGMITAAELAIHPLPAHREFFSCYFSNLESALEALRSLFQSGLKPAALRLYDGVDTLVATYGKGKKKKQKKDPSFLPVQAVMDRGFRFALSHPSLLNRLLKTASQKCLMLATFEGRKAITRAEKEELVKIVAPYGPKKAEGLAKHWWENRYQVSYKQSPVFDKGAFVDTMEIAAPWRKIPHLYREITRAIGDLAFVMAHFSHGYTTGSSIYFTFGAYEKDPQKREELYDTIWRKGLTACLEAGGAVSHHHGIGLSKAQFLRRDWGEEIFDLFRSLKESVDPWNIMNPGKLGLEGEALSDNDIRGHSD